MLGLRTSDVRLWSCQKSSFHPSSDRAVFLSMFPRFALAECRGCDVQRRALLPGALSSYAASFRTRLRFRLDRCTDRGNPESRSNRLLEYGDREYWRIGIEVALIGSGRNGCMGCVPQN